MKRKTRLLTGVDNRQVVLYARKSRITNKGDSIYNSSKAPIMPSISCLCRRITNLPSMRIRD